MTDEKIKEEFEKWLKGITTQEEADFANSFNPYYQDLAQGYIAGSRAAERLAKIEVLESVIAVIDCAYPKQEILSMIAKLKAGQ